MAMNGCKDCDLCDDTESGDVNETKIYNLGEDLYNITNQDYVYKRGISL